MRPAGTPFALQRNRARAQRIANSVGWRRMVGAGMAGGPGTISAEFPWAASECIVPIAKTAAACEGGFAVAGIIDCGRGFG